MHPSTEPNGFCVTQDNRNNRTVEEGTSGGDEGNNCFGFVGDELEWESEEGGHYLILFYGQVMFNDLVSTLRKEENTVHVLILK